MYHTEEIRPGVRVIAFASIVPGTHPGLDCEQGAEHRPAVGMIIIDLSRVVSLNRARLMTLLRFIAGVRAQGGDVGLVGLSGRVRILAQKMYLHRFVEIFNTVEEVYRSLGVPGSSSDEQMVESTRGHLATHQIPLNEPVSQEVLQ